MQLNKFCVKLVWGDIVSDATYIKTRTIELYDKLSMDLEIRKTQTDIRDEIFNLNYNFFCYLASHTYVNNSSVEYEDKLQSACTAFLEIWWKYRYTPEYRVDLAFTVFFGPRITEMIKREFNVVKYSTRRALCMVVGEQLNKPWGQVRYEDLSDPNVTLTSKQLSSLKSIFGSMYPMDIVDCELYLYDSPGSLIDSENTCYDSIIEFLIHEMIISEAKLTDKALLKLSEMFNIDFWELKQFLPMAEATLYQRLMDDLDVQDNFSSAEC